MQQTATATTTTATQPTTDPMSTTSAPAQVVAPKPPPPVVPSQMNGDAMPPAVDEKKESPSADGYLPETQQMHPDAAVTMNGGMPPQQVYVNTGMVRHGMPGLETQFQSLGMNDVPDVSHHDGEGTENDEEGNEDDPVKLFVGQVRRFRNAVS